MTVKNKNDIRTNRWNLAGISIMFCWTLFPKIIMGNIISTERMVLRVPKPSQTIEPWWLIDPDNPQSNSGFVPELYHELEAFENVTFEFVQVEDDYLKDLSNHTKFLLDEDIIDMTMDATFPLTMGYSYTIPFLMFDHRALIIQRVEKPSAARIFAPFKTQLWLLLFGSFVVGALSKSLTIRIGNGEIQKFSSLPSAVKHIAIDTLSTLLSFPSNEGGSGRGCYPFLRVYQLGFVFLVLITSSTYTANLAAILTKNTKTFLGPTNMKELKDAIVCTIWPDENDVEFFRRYAKEVLVPPVFTSFKQGREWAVDQLMNQGNCTAIVTSFVESNLILNDMCDKLQQPPLLRFAQLPYYHMMLTNTPKQKETFHRINNAFARLLSDPKIDALKSRYPHLENACLSKSEDEENSERIGVHEMSIPLVCHILMSVLSLLLTIIYCYMYGTTHDKTDEKNDKENGTN